MLVIKNYIPRAFIPNVEFEGSAVEDIEENKQCVWDVGRNSCKQNKMLRTDKRTQKIYVVGGGGGTTAEG